MGIEKAGVELTAIDGISRVFNQVNTAAKGVEKSFNDMKSAGEAVLGALAFDKVVEDIVAWEQANNRLNATLRATGNAVGFTRQQLDQMAASLSQSTPFNEKDIQNAEANLIKFGNIHDQVFSEALKLSADYAAFTGGDMVGATQAIGRALQDPIAGLRALSKEVGNLTFIEKQHIEQLLAAGKVEEAQAVVLKKVRDAIGGTAASSNTGVTASVAALGKAWDGLIAKVASTDLLRNMAGGAELLFRDISDQLGSHAPADDWAKGFEQQNQAVAQLVSTLKKKQEAQDREDEGRAKAAPILAQWNHLLQDQTNEQRALDFVLQGQGRTLADVYKAQILNIAVEADWRRVAKDRVDLAEREAKALEAFRDGTLGEEENVATRVKVIEDSWTKGTRETFQDYILRAKDGAQQAAFFFKNAFQNMEDALVSFAMTGKLNFHDFAQSVISDLIRIQIRQQLAGFVSSSAVAGAAGAIGGLFSFAPSATTAGNLGYFLHSGGEVGRDGVPRQVQLGTFVGAPRMHMGGLAGDEVPAILQRGETVLPRGVSAGAVSIHQTIHVGGNVSQADIPMIMAAANQGTMAAIAAERRRNPNGPFGG